MKAISLLAISLLALAAAPAMAGPSVGGSVSTARVNQGDFDGSDTGWKVFAGTSFTEVIGGEFGYVDFGNLGGDGPAARSWSLAATLGFPFDWAMPYGKAGISFADVEGSAVREEYRSEEPFFGVGLRFGPRDSAVGLRMEYERFDLDRDDIDLLSAGLELRF